jgi:hypothetical protein
MGEVYTVHHSLHRVLKNEPATPRNRMQIAQIIMCGVDHWIARLPAAREVPGSTLGPAPLGDS